MKVRNLLLVLALLLSVCVGSMANAGTHRRHSAAWYRAHRKHTAAWYRAHKRHSAAWYRTHKM